MSTLSYHNLEILRDRNGDPIPQKYDPDLGRFVPDNRVGEVRLTGSIAQQMVAQLALNNQLLSSILELLSSGDFTQPDPIDPIEPDPDPTDPDPIDPDPTEPVEIDGGYFTTTSFNNIISGGFFTEEHSNIVDGGEF